MERVGKVRLNRLLSAINKGVCEIQLLCLKEDCGNLEDICVACQETAVEIGTQIEREAPREKHIIEMLEEFCEEVYTAYNDALSNQRSQYDWMKIKHLLEQIEKEITRFPSKGTMFFLPYKAAMWDCMESIWEAACRDDRYESVVMPIPYFELICGNLQMRYDGALFPQYVPIEYYGSTVLAEYKPDVICIHNPYDDCNKVTSVHPDYYSTKLKQYTKLLVYVPYFICGRDFPKDHLGLPAYKNMDMIVVQDDWQKKQLEAFIPGSKIAALGSPKIDKLLRYKEHKPPIPKEWEEIAAGKKLVLYNVSLAGFLKYEGQFLKKMAAVFETFALREDTAVVYRPHPLLEATIKTMKPEFWTVYDKLINWFVQNRIGILDENADAAYTAAVCDAYIGERNSSIAKYCGVLGRPVFHMNSETMSPAGAENYQRVEMWDWYIEENWVWFINIMGNELCRASLTDGTTEIIADIPREKKAGRNKLLFSGIHKEGNTIYLIPLLADGIYEYDLTVKKFYKAVIKKSFADKYNFTKCYKHKNYLYLIPCYYPAIVRYDMRKREVAYFGECIEELMSNTIRKEENPAVCWWNGCVDGQHLYMKTAVGNYVLEFNMESDCYSIYPVPCNTNGFFDIQIADGELWMTPYKDNKVIKWRIGEKSAEEYLLDEEKNEKEILFPILCAVKTNQNVIFFPLENEQLVIRNLIDGIEKKFSDTFFTMAQKIDNDKVIAFNKRKNNFQIWKENGCIERIPVQIQETEAQRIAVRNISDNFFMDEKGLYFVCKEDSGQKDEYFISLEAFLEYLQYPEYEMMINAWEGIENTDGGSGKRIYCELVKKLRNI